MLKQQPLFEDKLGGSAGSRGHLVKQKQWPKKNGGWGGGVRVKKRKNKNG